MSGIVANGSLGANHALLGLFLLHCVYAVGGRKCSNLLGACKRDSDCCKNAVPLGCGGPANSKLFCYLT